MYLYLSVIPFTGVEVYTPQADTPFGQTPPWADTSPNQSPPESPLGILYYSDPPRRSPQADPSG